MAESPIEKQNESGLDAQNKNVDAPLPENVLLDVADMSGYDKNIKNGRIWLYVLSGFQAVAAVYGLFNSSEEDYGYIGMAIDLGIAAVFLACAIWSYKKPKLAFLTALVCYIGIMVLLAIIDPGTLLKGIILKVLAIIALVKAFRDARESDLLKQAIGTV